jgi:hypothetical protein
MFEAADVCSKRKLQVSSNWNTTLILGMIMMMMLEAQRSTQYVPEFSKRYTVSEVYQ